MCRIDVFAQTASPNLSKMHPHLLFLDAQTGDYMIAVQHPRSQSCTPIPTSRHTWRLCKRFHKAQSHGMSLPRQWTQEPNTGHHCHSHAHHCSTKSHDRQGCLESSTPQAGCWQYFGFICTPFKNTNEHFLQKMVHSCIMPHLSCWINAKVPFC